MKFQETSRKGIILKIFIVFVIFEFGVCASVPLFLTLLYVVLENLKKFATAVKTFKLHVF